MVAAFPARPLLRSARTRPSGLTVATIGAMATGAALAVVAAPHLSSYRLAIVPAHVEPLPPQVAAGAPLPVAVPASATKPIVEPVMTTRPTVAREAYQLAWPYDIADGLTFGPEGSVKTRLAGLEGPSRDAVCNDRYGQPWACGLQARAALNNITRRQSLSCQPVGAQDPDRPISARCSGAIDVARELVLAGFARPVGRDPELDGAEDEARLNGRGLWNGGWTVRMAGR